MTPHSGALGVTDRAIPPVSLDLSNRFDAVCFIPPLSALGRVCQQKNKKIMDFSMSRSNKVNCTTLGNTSYDTLLKIAPKILYSKGCFVAVCEVNCTTLIHGGFS